MSAQPLQVKFTVEDFYQMIKHGILLENPREEIIDGVLYRMPSSTPPHAALHSKLGAYFFRRFDDKFSRVFTNCPIMLDEYNEPIPDFCLLNKDKKEIGDRHPKADEVDLVLEIADETIDFDRDVKIPLYAAAKIPEVWLINLTEGKIDVYSKSVGKVYNSRKIFQRGEVIQSEILPNLRLEVTTVLD